MIAMGNAKVGKSRVEEEIARDCVEASLKGRVANTDFFYTYVICLYFKCPAMFAQPCHRAGYSTSNTSRSPAARNGPAITEI
jgi:hypothetical protein